MTHATCPRCGGPVREPGLWSSAWRCAAHGDVAPYRVAGPGERVLARVAAASGVPVWVPHPLPHGWLLTGTGWAGDERSGARASVVALSGPSPLGGPAELLLVAEEAGVGLGAALAGLPGPDPGEALSSRSEAKVEVAGHPVALWGVQGPADRSVLVGEAEAVWLWALLWPAGADLLLLERLVLHDARAGVPPGAGYGAVSPRLQPAPA